MKYSEASNEQLQYICKDDDARLKDRYSAARELSIRQKGSEKHEQEMRLSWLQPSQQDDLGDD